MDNTPLKIALLAVPESTASTVYGMYDLFAGAGRDWGMLIEGKPKSPRLQPVIASRSTVPFQAGNGLWIRPETGLGPDAPAVICISDLFLPPEESIAGRFDAEITWIRECHAAGTIIATACSGALVLAEAGLLDGQDATTHWGYCDAMSTRYPKVSVHRDRALVVAGAGQRLVMGGGGTSWLDLALFLIARLVSVEEAMRTARLHLIDWHSLGQLPFAALNRTRPANDAVIQNCQTWIAQNYQTESPVATMAKIAGLAERSFKRRFEQATGMSPLEYVHTLRLEEAKQVLESTETPVEAVAWQVGYQDSSFFSRLFRRKVGLTPAQYRRRFGSLRQGLLHQARPGAAATP